MFNLISFFDNFFEAARISDDNLKKFVQDHLARLAANNGGGDFTTILNDMTLAYTGYFGKITDTDLAKAVQQSLTMSADNLITTFKKTVSQKEGAIKSQYGADSPTYQEFFPYGLTEYSKATKANVETLMTRMVSSCTAHVADLGAAMVALFANIQSNYVTARTLQLSKIAEVSTDISDKHATRDVVELQLCRNVHYIGYSFPGNADRCMDFFDQSIIRPNVNHDHDGLGRAAGVVTDLDDDMPIKDVVVDYPYEGVASRSSKADGTYRAVNVHTGMRVVRFTHPLYETADLNINIVDEGDTPLNVKLKKKP